MPRQYRVYHGEIYEDAGGYTLDPHGSWDESDVLLQFKPWHDPLLFYKYLNHLAEWREEGGEVYLRGDSGPTKVERGQLYKSLPELGKVPGWGKDKVRRTLKLLEKVGKITVEARRNGMMITIVDYARYQDPKFYRATRARHDSDETPEKRTAKRDGKCDAGNLPAASTDSTAVRGGPATPIATVLASCVRRGCDGNITPNPVLDCKTPDARARDDGGSVDRITWQAIAKVIELDLWRFCPEEIKAMQLRQAASAGSPPATLGPTVRSLLLQEAVRLGVLPAPEAEAPIQAEPEVRAAPAAEVEHPGEDDCLIEPEAPAPDRALVRQELEQSWAEDRAGRLICSEPEAPGCAIRQVREPPGEDGRGG